MTLAILIAATALLLSMVLNLVLKPSFSTRLTRACMYVALFGGLLIYGIGFAKTVGPLQSIIRIPFAVIRMFVGVNELSAIDGFRFLQTEIGQVVFWLIHLLAFYSMASAVMYTLGAEALRKLRLLLSRRGDLTLIFGINDHSISLGQESRAAGEAVIFVAETADTADTELVKELNEQGMSVLTGQAAADSEKSVIRKLHLGKRKLTVYAMDRKEDRDLFYALKLKDTLEKLKIPPENTRLTLPGAEEILTPMLQASVENYGFGYVQVYNRHDLTARALIHTCPPWEQIRFYPDGRAAEDFHCAIVGFGRQGQAVLKQLCMNGQFTGSSFHAAVFSPEYAAESGYLQTDCPELLKNYDIRFFDAEGRSRSFYDYVAEHLNDLKLIAVCTGSEELNAEISDNLMLFLKRHGAEQICVIQCGRDGVRYQESVGSPIIRAEIYSLAFLDAEIADRSAILLNSSYDRTDRSDWEKWLACDSFSKASSRASADFTPALIRSLSSSREEILADGWKPSSEQLRNLGETEHRRWCAFHYSMGYRPMSREEMKHRARLGLRVSKDQETRSHACLIPWEKLDELSAFETGLTGESVDYKQLDINNVLAIPKLLRAEEKK